MLVIYLVLNRARPVGRRELLDVLWPDEPPHTAETTLTGVLSRLRHVLAENVLQGREQLRLALPADAWIDVEVALRAIHDAEAAVLSGEWPQAWISGEEEVTALQGWHRFLDSSSIEDAPPLSSATGPGVLRFP